VGKGGDGERPYSFDFAKASTASLASAVRLWGDLRPGEPFPAAGEKVPCFCPYHQNKDDEASAGFIVNLKDGRVKLHCFATGKSWAMADLWAFARRGVTLGTIRPSWVESWDRRMQRDLGLIAAAEPVPAWPDDYSDEEKTVLQGLWERQALEGEAPVGMEFNYGALWSGLSFNDFVRVWKRLGQRHDIYSVGVSDAKGQPRKRYGVVLPGTTSPEDKEPEEWFNRLVSWPWAYETDRLFYWDDFAEAVQTLSSLITAKKALPEHREPAPSVRGKTNDNSANNDLATLCRCGCLQTLGLGRNGKPKKWAGPGCKERFYRQTQQRSNDNSANQHLREEEV
jgi:hypothetical protein